MRLTVDFSEWLPAPKRGDLIHTNVGKRRERTCLILAARRLRSPRPQRFRVWAERWWQLEPDFRNRLFRSAERNGGQNLIQFRRYPTKKKRPALRFSEVFR